jgi:hypothetical protein
LNSLENTKISQQISPAFSWLARSLLLAF